MRQPRGYVCPFTSSTPPLNDLNHPSWQAAEWITEWHGILGGETNPTSIEAKLLWDHTHLYLAARMEEHDLWAFQTEHDSSVWLDNAFELFLDPDCDGHNYFEWEINPLGVILDMSMDRPYICGGTRCDDLEIPDLGLVLVTDGAVNDPSATERGWRFGAAFPWTFLTQIGQSGKAPSAGDTWKFNMMKMFWPVEVRDGVYVKDHTQPEKYWTFAPTNVLDIHRPHIWGSLHFAESAGDVPADEDWDTKFGLIQAVGLDSRSRAEGLLPREDLRLLADHIVLEHESGFAVRTMSPSGRFYTMTADGRLMCEG